MFEPTPPEASLAIQRQRIRQLFTAGQLTAESATVQLLRLDIGEVTRVRKTQRTDRSCSDLGDRLTEVGSE
jgi:hypothetical protein